MDIATRQRRSKPKRPIVLYRRRRRAFYAITGATVAVVLACCYPACCYLAFEYLSSSPRVPIHRAEPSAREPTPSIDIVSSAPSDKSGRDGPGETGEDLGASERPANAKPFQERAIADAPALDSAPATADIAMARDFGVNDARYYRERGVSAYRSGDLYLALVQFNLAISLDPNFLGAFVDRAVVYHRLGDLERALADVAEAKRIGNSDRSNASVTAVKH